MKIEKSPFANNSLSQFVREKFKNDDLKIQQQYLILATFLDDIGDSALGMSAESLFKDFKNEGLTTFHTSITKETFQTFISNTFVNKFLDNKVLSLQRPKIREVLMRLSSADDSSITPNDLKAIEMLRTIVDKNDFSNNDVTYIYVTTPTRGAADQEIEKLLEKHCKIENNEI